MATSSITANFRIDNPKAVRFLVRELCSNKPWRMPSVRVKSHHVSNGREIDAFFAQSPYSRKERVLISA